MRIAITGGRGFVGSCLTEQLHAIPLSREAFSLELMPAGNVLQGYDVLIHAAWDFAATDRRNIEGSKRLFDAARAAGVKQSIFISTLSAFEGCQSQYGADKLAVEKEVLALGGCVVRLGFVCDDSGRGLSGALKKLAALPVVLLPSGGTPILFTIQTNDLGPAFAKIIANFHPGIVNLANPRPVTFAEMMRTFGARVLLPVPWRLLWLPLRIAEAAGLKLKFRSDSLVSLMNQNPSPDFGNDTLRSI